MSDTTPDKPVIFDEDNPEWTDEDFAKAKPSADFPDLLAAMAKRRGPQKAAPKTSVSIRLDSDLVTALRDSGPGWQSRANDMLRREMKLG